MNSNKCSEIEKKNPSQYCVYLFSTVFTFTELCLSSSRHHTATQLPTASGRYLPPLSPPPHPLPTRETSMRSDKGTEGDGAASSGRSRTFGWSTDSPPPPMQHTGATASYPSSLSPTALGALALFCNCLENDMSARLVMRSVRGGNSISFTCSEFKSSAARSTRPVLNKVRRTRGGEKSG
jgi:hypothetical protein